MKAKAANLLGIIKGPRQFVIPIYQRAYSWNLGHCEKLLEDILRISKDESTPGHFIGSVVHFEDGIHTISDVEQHLVIDGQQRLTTISLLIVALANFIRDKKVPIDTTTTKLFNYYLVNPEEDGDLHFKLLLTRKDKETLIHLLKGIPMPSEVSPRIVENYEYFKSRVTDQTLTEIYNGIQKLFVVDVALEKEVDNPQLIFESLNSTGLVLSQGDLIRNFVLMGQPLKLQKELYEMYWFPMEQGYGGDYNSRFNAFMRDFLSLKINRIPRIDQVYDEFKNYALDPKHPKNIKDVVEEIARYSGYYAAMVLGKEKDDELKAGFKSIIRLKVDVAYPFLLPVYGDYATGIINKDEFLQILHWIENYVFRRAICGIPTNSLNKTFATLYKSVKQDAYLKSVEFALGTMDSYKRFPSDSEFALALSTREVYSFRNRNYLLARLENYERKEPINVEAYTVEHVVPQNPELRKEWREMLGDNWKTVQEKYLHSLGNLTLTGYNPELSDRPFSEKKSIEGGFNDSPLRLNEAMRKTDVWNEQAIKKRGEELAAKAVLIWDRPQVEMAEMLEYMTVGRVIEYPLEHYEYLKDEMLELFFALRQRIMNIDSSVREEHKKPYIAFKSTTNFVDVVPQKSRLRLTLNMDFHEIIDPLNLCEDVSDKGRWGNGDVQVSVRTLADLDNVMELVQQAFDAQVEFS